MTRAEGTFIGISQNMELFSRAVEAGEDSPVLSEALTSFNGAVNGEAPDYLVAIPAMSYLASSKLSIAQDAVRACLGHRDFGIRVNALDALIRAEVATDFDLTRARFDIYPEIRERAREGMAELAEKRRIAP